MLREVTHCGILNPIRCASAPLERFQIIEEPPARDTNPLFLRTSRPKLFSFMQSFHFHPAVVQGRTTFGSPTEPQMRGWQYNWSARPDFPRRRVPAKRWRLFRFA
jgi:hypothetical protein